MEKDISKQIKREVTPHINPNDCWALVISRIAGKKYDDIYKGFMGKFADEAGLKSDFIEDILASYSYFPVSKYGIKDFSMYGLTVEKTVRDVMLLYYDYHIVIGSWDFVKGKHHLSYAYKGIEYTTSETDKTFENPVMFIWAKWENADFTSPIMKNTKKEEEK